MADALPVDDKLIDAFGEAFEEATAVLDKSDIALDTDQAMTEQIRTIASDVYHRICKGKGISPDELQLKYLVTALTVHVSSRILSGAVSSGGIEIGELQQRVLEVLHANPRFPHQDVGAETENAIKILETLARKYGIELQPEDRRAFAIMVHLECSSLQ